MFIFYIKYHCFCEDFSVKIIVKKITILIIIKPPYIWIKKIGVTNYNWNIVINDSLKTPLIKTISQYVMHEMFLWRIYRKKNVIP